jgi:hypothetical protein
MAKGSHATWDGMPRTCAGCGETLRITKDTLWLDSHARESWHVDCRLTTRFFRYGTSGHPAKPRRRKVVHEENARGSG